MNEYISREALLRDIEESVVFTGREGVTSAEMRGAHKVTDRIKAAPAADVVKVRHGEWIVTKTEFGWNCAEYPSEYTCSLCGRTEQQTEPYCHCGAKMDGKRKDGAGE